MLRAMQLAAISVQEDPDGGIRFAIFGDRYSRSWNRLLSTCGAMKSPNGCPAVA